MTWLRSALFNLLFFTLSAALAVAMLPLVAAPRRWVLGPLRAWSQMTQVLLRWVCGITLRVTGREHLPESGPALIAAKHQSAFDTIIWLSLVPDVAYVLKRELLSIPVYGTLVRKAEMIAVDRGAGASAMRGLIRD